MALAHGMFRLVMGSGGAYELLAGASGRVLPVPFGKPRRWVSDEDI